MGSAKWEWGSCSLKDSPLPSTQSLTWSWAAVTRPVALKSSDITMVKRVALRLWPVDTEPKARRRVKVARIFSTVRVRGLLLVLYFLPLEEQSCRGHVFSAERILPPRGQKLILGRGILLSYV